MLVITKNKNEFSRNAERVVLKKQWPWWFKGWIKLSLDPMVSAGFFFTIYPLVGGSPVGWHYPSFEELGPDFYPPLFFVSNPVRWLKIVMWDACVVSLVLSVLHSILTGVGTVLVSLLESQLSSVIIQIMKLLVWSSNLFKPSFILPHVVSWQIWMLLNFVMLEAATNNVLLMFCRCLWYS